MGEASGRGDRMSHSEALALPALVFAALFLLALLWPRKPTK